MGQNAKKQYLRVAHCSQTTCSKDLAHLFYFYHRNGHVTEVGYI